jgi:7-cyano-7-deazaguanine synthase in queuosine biosynthesis
MLCETHEVANKPDNWMCWNDMGFEHWPHTGCYVITMAATYAHYIGAEYVVSGLRSDNVPDRWRQQAQDFLTGSKITPAPVLVFPLFDKSAADAGIKKAEELGIDITDTHSCWIDPPCGECHKCEARNA